MNINPFRVINKKTGRFVPNVLASSNGVLYIPDALGLQAISRKDYRVYRSTGIIDQNDRMIYEGDVVSVRHEHNGKIVTSRGFVLFYEGTVRIHFTYNRRRWICNLECDEITIVSRPYCSNIKSECAYARPLEKKELYTWKHSAPSKPQITVSKAPPVDILAQEPTTNQRGLYGPVVKVKDMTELATLRKEVEEKMKTIPPFQMLGFRQMVGKVMFKGDQAAIDKVFVQSLSMPITELVAHIMPCYLHYFIKQLDKARVVAF
jgi:hypothetical protein